MQEFGGAGVTPAGITAATRRGATGEAGSGQPIAATTGRVATSGGQTSPDAGAVTTPELRRRRKKTNIVGTESNTYAAATTGV